MTQRKYLLILIKINKKTPYKIRFKLIIQKMIAHKLLKNKLTKNKKILNNKTIKNYLSQN
jgi:hypothetical protein